VHHSISQEGAVCIEEEQDIVYREQGAPVSAAGSVALPPVPPGAWTRTVTPDPILLFRFSALTFNAHRIHYDRPYATAVEGYPGLVVHGPLAAVLLLELVRFGTGRAVQTFTFRGQAPLFDLAPFRLVAVPSESRVELEAQGPDGRVTMTAAAELA
jgi:3-methylfumaryl-CoA hydratase